MTGRIYLISGPSSSGKSSLARALQAVLPRPAILIEADRAFPVMPVDNETWRSSGYGGPRGSAIVTFHRSVGVWAEQGYDVILDGSLPYGDEGLRDRCLSAVSAYDLTIVGVIADDAALRYRERSRPESRPAGWASKQARDIHHGIPLSALVDTSRSSPEESAQDVLRQLGVR